LQENENAVRNIAINLYKYDYLDGEEIKKSVEGKSIDKENVREYDPSVEKFIVKE